VLARYPDTNPTSLCIAGHSDAPGPSNRGWCCQGTDAQLLKMAGRGVYIVVDSNEKMRGQRAALGDLPLRPGPRVRNVAVSPNIPMSDPLVGFNWQTLYRRYEESCRRLNLKSEHLREVYPAPSCDRDVYHYLAKRATPEQRSSITAGWYEALLYWKLYSDPRAVANIRGWLQGLSLKLLLRLLREIPETLPREISRVVPLVKLVGLYQLPGMKTCALPVRTTFLHMLYPNVIPIFDQMVLKAVGAWYEGANQNIEVLRRYIPHAWALADRHSKYLSGFSETRVRLIDMALWVSRGRT